MKFRKKPVVIEALQWTGDNIDEVSSFLPSITYHGTDGKKDGNLLISTLEGKIRASRNDWIIKGVNGEFYPCKPDIFEKTYEKAE
jgi:hypothetical protein